MTFTASPPHDPAIDAAAQAIVDAHGATFAAEHPPHEGIVLAHGDTGEPPVLRAARAACTALGFIPADAECLAQAWQRRADRTGTFEPGYWPDQPVDFALAPWPREHAFAPCPRQLGLYAVLPDAAWVGRMARAGVPTVQLRFKHPDAHAVAQEVRRAVQAVEGTGALLFVNDHWQAAIDAGAYGVHLGQEDLDTADLGAIRAAGLRLGLSTHGYAEMCRVDALTPSYVAMGAVFPTTLKQMPTAPQGVPRLMAYARLMRDHPLVAIGGIDAQRVPAVLQSGVGSIAVVRAITAAPHPEQAAAELQSLIAQHLRG